MNHYCTIWSTLCAKNNLLCSLTVWRDACDEEAYTFVIHAWQQYMTPVLVFIKTTPPCEGSKASVQIPGIEAALTSYMWSTYIIVLPSQRFALKQRCSGQPWNLLHGWLGHICLFANYIIWLASLYATTSITLHKNINITRLCTQGQPYCYRRLEFPTHMAKLYNIDIDMHCSYTCKCKDSGDSRVWSLRQWRQEYGIKLTNLSSACRWGAHGLGLQDELVV